MKSRNKWIAAVFLMMMIVVPLITLARSAKTVWEREAAENDGEEETAVEDNGEAAGTGWFVNFQASVDNFTENLAGRSELIAFNTQLTSFLTGGTYIESTQVLQGKNNMLFYKTKSDGHPPLWDYMGIDHFSDEELEEITENLVSTQKQLAEMGIEFYAICVPNKEIIYPENMPDTIVRVEELSRGEQLCDYVNENTDLVFIYPKEELSDNKEEGQLYYLTDTHCSQMGAFVVMQALFQAAYGTYEPLSSVKFVVTSTNHAGDLANLAGLASDEKYQIDTEYVFDVKSANAAQYHDQALLFVGDSFGGFLSVVCSGYYREVYWIYPDDFDYSMYEEYNPDVIIWEQAERYCASFVDPVLTE